MKYKIFVLFHARKNLKILEREKDCIYNDFRDFKMQGLRESGSRNVFAYSGDQKAGTHSRSSGDQEAGTHSHSSGDQEAGMRTRSD